MKLSVATLLIGFILLVSGIALPATAAAVTAGASTSSSAPTYAGPASGLGSGPISGPIRVSTFISPAVTLSIPSSPQNPPNPNPKPITALADPPTVPPTVSCQPLGPGCDLINANSGGTTTNPFALNAVNSGSLYGYDIEPPDQTICAGNGYVMEVLNIGELQVYNSKLQPVSGAVSLDSLMGLTSLNWGSGGDISCLYDYGNGGHWFITEFVSTTPEPESPFVGCFVGVLDTCREGIAVSVTNNPMGPYNVYFFDPNDVNNDVGKGYLLNDFAKIGTTRDAFLMFYDEYNQNPSTYPACPAFGCNGFNGAQQFAINKNALELGLPASSPYFNMAYENMGTAPSLYPIPANGQYQPSAASCFSGPYAGSICWYQVIPAQSPDPSQFDNSNGGTGLMVGSLDFLGHGDNRIATFDWTGLSQLLSSNCKTCGGISFGEQLITGQVTYMDEGAACLASNGGFCGLAPQKTGPTPLGDECVAFMLNSSDVPSCPESGIATNGDGATQVSYAQGQLWVAVSTLITQTFSNAPSEIHVGATYWIIGTNPSDAQNSNSVTPDFKTSFTLTAQGYVTASHEDIEFPSIAAADAGGVFPLFGQNNVGALMTFTLSGNGGPSGADKGGFYPSTAYGLLSAPSEGFAATSASSGGLNAHTIYISALGKSPEDGFGQYQGYPTGTRPRWGDYSWAIFEPGTPGSAVGHFYFASEYIQSPNCSDKAFLADPTCGGTRDPNANWGSSVNSLATGFGFGQDSNNQAISAGLAVAGVNLASANLQATDLNPALATPLRAH